MRAEDLGSKDVIRSDVLTSSNKSLAVLDDVGMEYDPASSAEGTRRGSPAEDRAQHLGPSQSLIDSTAGKHGDGTLET